MKISLIDNSARNKDSFIATSKQHNNLYSIKVVY